MKARQVGSALVAVAAAATLVGVSAPGAQAAPSVRAVASDTRTNPAGAIRPLMSAAGFQDLLDTVTAQVHAAYPTAVFADAIGTSSTGATTSIRDVTTWRFLFNDTQNGQPVVVDAAVFLPSWTASILVRSAYVASAPTAPVSMSPFQATLFARLAGYGEPFRQITYAQPTGLAKPYPHPIYIITTGTARIAVDTVTREVTPFS